MTQKPVPGMDTASNGRRPARAGTVRIVLALRFYDAVVALHVMAIVVAFGVIFTYPVVLPWLRRNHPGSMVVVHHVQARVRRLIIGPAATLALVAGVYLASDAGVWSEVWVIVPFVILVAILGVSGGVLGPTETRLVELASGGVDSPEYAAVFRRMLTMVTGVAIAVLVAIFFMVTKLGA